MWTKWNLTGACAAALMALAPTGAWAQDKAGAYPSRPITLIQPYAPGPSSEKEIRPILNKLSEIIGQPFTLDYKPGAGTVIGTAYVAKAAPDGYTLLQVAASFTILPNAYKDLPFDIVRDFAPVSMMFRREAVLLVHPSFPARTVPEYFEYAKANPGKINIGTAAAGGGPHLAGEWMHNLTGTKATFVHYKGAAGASIDLVAGRVQAMITALVTGLPLAKSGKVRALAIVSSERSKHLPGVPTIAETVPGFDYGNWGGTLAPAGTPAAVVNKLSEGFARVAKMPDVIADQEAQGNSMVGSTPEQFRQVIVTEAARWRKLVQDNGIKMTEQ